MNCHANGCPFAGSMFRENARTVGWCAYHYSAPPGRVPEVTRCLAEHDALARVVIDGRHGLMTVHEKDGCDLVKLCIDAERRLRAAGYGVDQVPAYSGRVVDGAGWLYKVECALGAIVVDALGPRRRQPETTA